MSENQTTASSTFLGIPRVLLWGYVAVILFMVGDGMELAFLAKYMVTLGFGEAGAAHVITAYGVGIAISSWLAGVLADTLGPRRTMVVGLVVWLVFHVAFLTLGLMQASFIPTLLLYGLRGFGYPLFAYSFVVWISHVAPQERLATAMGWFWFSYSVGFLAIGNYLPSFLIPRIGFLGTLWLEVAWILAGGLMGIFLVRSNFQGGHAGESTRAKLGEAAKGITIVYENWRVGIAGIVRIINQIALFGFPVMLPIFLTTDQIGFTITQWLQIWGTMGVANLIFNVIWGAIGDRIGWRMQVMWFGCVGTAITSLLLYYVPVTMGNNFWLVLATACLFGITMAAFVPMSAIIPSLAPDHRGAAMSIHNLAAGLSNFAGPAIVGIVLAFGTYQGVVWVFAVVYLIGAFLTIFLKVGEQQPETEPATETRPAETTG